MAKQFKMGKSPVQQNVPLIALTSDIEVVETGHKQNARCHKLTKHTLLCVVKNVSAKKSLMGDCIIPIISKVVLKWNVAK